MLLRLARARLSPPRLLWRDTREDCACPIRSADRMGRSPDSPRTVPARSYTPRSAFNA
jgi:hypothetical protein